MARSAARGRNAPPPSVKDLIRSRSGTALDGLAMVAVGLAAGLLFGYSPDARRWVLESLGYGLIPATLWVTVAVIVLRYHRRAMVRFWRRWISSAAFVATAMWTLSFFHAGNGTLAEIGLGGRWGAALAGEDPAIAVFRLAGLVLFLPLLLYPRPAARTYLSVLRRFGLGFQYAITYIYLIWSHSSFFVSHYVGRALSTRFHQRLIGYLRSLFASALSVIPRPRYGESEANVQTRVTFSESAGEDDFPIDEDAEANEDWDIAAEPLKRHPRPEVVAVKVPHSKWPLPSMDCLSPPVTRDLDQAPLEAMARHVETTLAEHGVAVEVKDIRAGPRIVRFGLVPGWVNKKGEAGKEDGGDSNRVKVQSSLMREKDLALALKTPNLRIEAPVPGEALVGLEVPAPSTSKVHLRDVMESEPFRKISTNGGLPVALGQDTGGNPVALDLAALPHLLIAGATGSGKSVCINSIVASLLLTKPPDQMRILMIDPKRVELTPFNGIPHLLAPVIVDVDEVNSALLSLMREMFRRYKQMEEVGTHNIAGYNAKAQEPLPYLVLIVDELADLMMSGGFEVEQNLVRLAQLGRATGIHLVLATQRPSVNVVTGLLKANIPARVAFAVASQVDSRVILDTVGAEKLLGKGDMLLLSPDSPKPRRVQGTLVYDDEIDQLVKFWRNQSGPPLPVILTEELEDEEGDGDGLDERMLEQARELALRNPRVSSSFLERRFKIGRQRAAQMMEHLEEEGLIIPG